MRKFGLIVRNGEFRIYVEEFNNVKLVDSHVTGKYVEGWDTVVYDFMNVTDDRLKVLVGKLRRIINDNCSLDEATERVKTIYWCNVKPEVCSEGSTKPPMEFIRIALVNDCMYDMKDYTVFNSERDTSFFTLMANKGKNSHMYYRVVYDIIETHYSNKEEVIAALEKIGAMDISHEDKVANVKDIYNNKNVWRV